MDEWELIECERESISPKNDFTAKIRHLKYP